MENAENNY
jgi:hypothetical protein